MKNTANRLVLLLVSVFYFSYFSFSQSDSSQKKSTDSSTKLNEIPPSFPGGEKALMEFINKNIIYPKKAVRNKIQGTVYVKFLINENGEAVNFEIMNKTKLGYGLEEAAIEVLKKMPKWSPGYQNNKPVNVSLIIPITFKVKK